MLTRCSYWAFKSQLSIDGLPGMKRGYEFAQTHSITPLKKMTGKAGELAQSGGTAKEKIEVWHLFAILLLGMVIGGAASLSLVTPERLGLLRGGGVVR